MVYFLRHQVSLRKRDNVHCRNKLNSLKRYTYLKITKFSPSIQVKGRWTVFAFPAMQIFPFLTKNRGMFQKKIAYFKYILQLQVFMKKIKPTFHWQPLRSLRALQSRNRPVAGEGGGGLESPPQKFQTWVKFCYKSGIFLLKWTAFNGS